MAIRGILAKTKFVAWLQKQPKRKVVGIAGRADCCPLANYLSSPGDTAVVQTTRYFAPDGWCSPPRPLPKWAQRFVQRVDTEVEDGVLPDQALAFLGTKRPTKEVKRVAKTKKKGGGKKGC